MQTTTKPSYDYESIEFNLTDGQTDYDLDDSQSTFLAVFNNNEKGYPTQVMIRTNNTISVRLNSASNHAITITSTDSPVTIKGIVINNMFLTNSSGSTAAVKLLFQEVDS